ncbi:MAG: phosphate acetyltransferase [Calditrichaeota bacterium]|nr:MAG: phosphate acetyltransferase [Calditrichota bacterium]
MNVLTKIKDKAKTLKRRVVLPESTDPRMIQAAKKLVSDDIAKVTFVGDADKMKPMADEFGLMLNKVEIINPLHSSDLNGYIDDFKELRKHKNISDEEARNTVLNPLFFGAMLVKNDKADASVAGALNTTGDVMRAAIQVLGLKAGIKTVSSCFMMTIPKYREELNKIFFYADCAVMPNPTAEQLVSIAKSTAETAEALLGIEPKIAFLSFSTKGSAKHSDVTKVQQAVEMFKKEYPDIKADGEFQLDAAIVPEIGAKKAPGSEIAGDANILIFPDLDAGNIGYKLTQRLANATATGPIIQGLAKPANDLSRGCSVQDIVDVSAIALLLKE